MVTCMTWTVALMVTLSIVKNSQAADASYPLPLTTTVKPILAMYVHWHLVIAPVLIRTHEVIVMSYLTPMYDDVIYRLVHSNHLFYLIYAWLNLYCGKIIKHYNGSSLPTRRVTMCAECQFHHACRRVLASTIHRSIELNALHPLFPSVFLPKLLLNSSQVHSCTLVVHVW